jgi:hypothetical protein
MLDIGSISWSHVFFEAESDGYFSKALSAEVESVFSYDGSVLATAFAWASSLSILSLLLRFQFGHDASQFPMLVPKLLCMNLTASSLDT